MRDSYLLLQDVHLVAHQDLYWNLASPLALSDPLLDSVESWSLGHIEQVDDGGAAVDILVDVLVMPLLAWHVEVHYLVLVCVIDIECRLPESWISIAFVDLP